MFPNWGAALIDAKDGKKKKVPREGILQAACVSWFRLQYPNLILFSSVNGAVLNGSKEQRARQWATLKREGAMKGVSDLFLSYASGGFHGLYIEMKQGGNKQTLEQKEFQKRVESFGYKYIVCSSIEQFQDSIADYIV